MPDLHCKLTAPSLANAGNGSTGGIVPVLEDAQFNDIVSSKGAKNSTRRATRPSAPSRFTAISNAPAFVISFKIPIRGSSEMGSIDASKRNVGSSAAIAISLTA